ncbi:MAG: hypothetical protein EON90_02770 [Brevundimonas sp.]|nr:MAG: hypothetical protein EON90_02770 [Brevundimonas sp.]
MRVARALAASALLLGGCVAAPDREAPALAWAADPFANVEALPRVDADTPQAREINAFLDRMDARDREERAACLADESPESGQREWGRSVEAPMTGPRFISLLVTTGYYCGGAHPSWGQKALTFDLASGRQVDWAAVFPAEMATPRDDATDHWPQLLLSRSLKAWYAQTAVAQRGTAIGHDDCADTLAGSEPLNAWPDAKTGGLALQVIGLAHAATACTERVVMPREEMRRRGVDAVLLDALDTARRDGLWRPARPERAR